MQNNRIKVKTIPLRPTNFGLYVVGGLFQSTIAIYFYTHFDAAILRLMPDDAFYYLKIAENISHGLGSVFSPNELTNGYHPLWMAVLVSLHWLFQPTPEQFIALVLAVSVSLNIIAAHLLGMWLQTVGFSLSQSFVGAACYLFAPWLVFLTLTGLETPLYYACLFGFLWITQRGLNGAPFTWRYSVLLGLSAGLVMLSRTDAVLFTLVAFCVLLFTRPAVFWSLILVGGLATLVLTPWLGWNFFTFGTIEQSSSLEPV